MVSIWGQSLNVCGFRPPDEEWKKMKAIYDACVIASVPIPDEVDIFFDGEPPDETGISIDMEEKECCTDYDGDMREGFQIDLKKIPKNIRFIRFFVSY
jgi:hypothetical protein